MLALYPDPWNRRYYFLFTSAWMILITGNQSILLCFALKGRLNEKLLFISRWLACGEGLC